MVSLRATEGSEAICHSLVAHPIDKRNKKQKRHGEDQDVMISCHHYGINEIKNKKTWGAE
jgi:hypothetical protein